MEYVIHVQCQFHCLADNEQKPWGRRRDVRHLKRYRGIKNNKRNVHAASAWVNERNECVALQFAHFTRLLSRPIDSASITNWSIGRATPTLNPSNWITFKYAINSYKFLAFSLLLLHSFSFYKIVVHARSLDWRHRRSTCQWTQNEIHTMFSRSERKINHSVSVRTDSMRSRSKPDDWSRIRSICAPRLHVRNYARNYFFVASSCETTMRFAIYIILH